MASKRRMCSADWFRSAFDCCYYRRPMEERAINFPLSSSCRMSRQHPPLLRPRCIGLCPPTGDALNVLGVGCLYLIFFFFSSWRRFLLLLLLRRCHFPPNLLYPPLLFPLWKCLSLFEFQMKQSAVIYGHCGRICPHPRRVLHSDSTQLSIRGWMEN